ncbi:glycosyltransferase [Candidatus Shapirobacteria bacterium]|nr:glycosyltransferase [Candidatus Shapirobacteria bacterium]
MKILMITPYLPYPPLSGGQTRSYNLIRYLSKNHQITLFSFIRQKEENQQVKVLRKYCQKIRTFDRGPAWSIKKILFAGLTPYPFLVANYYSRQLQKAIKEELKTNRYDLIHVECFYLMPNLKGQKKIPVVLVDQTIEYEVYRHVAKTLPAHLFFLKPFYYLDAAKVYFWEKRFWEKADQTAAVSEDDKKVIKKHLPKLSVAVVENGVDPDQFIKRTYRRASQPAVLFGVANFKWIQNREAAEILLKEIWPQIKKRVKNAQLWIIGRYAPLYFGNFDNHKLGITVKEAENVNYFYQKAWLLLAPIKSGGGSRTKFFEAMAAGLPIITTPDGAEGLRAKNNREIIIAKSDQALVKKSLLLIRNKKLAQKIGKNGQKLVLAKYTWGKSAQALEEVYQRVAEKQKDKTAQ